MTVDRLSVLLWQMRDASAELEQMLTGVHRERLDSDLTVRRALAMELLMISDLIGKIQTRFPEFVAAHPTIDWAQIRGFRNRLAHDYFNLDMDVIWHSATVEVPTLIAALKPSIPPSP